MDIPGNNRSVDGVIVRLCNVLETLKENRRINCPFSETYNDVNG